MRTWTMTAVGLALLLGGTGCGGRLFHRRCTNDAAPKRDDRDLDIPRGVIPPRTETIPSPSLPTGPRSFDPSLPDGRRSTFSAPRLQMPVEPYRPAPSYSCSPSDLPEQVSDLPFPYESKKLETREPAKGVEPVRPAKPKKLMLVPDSMPDTKSESSYTPKNENGLPVPDRAVFLDPIAPGERFDLPQTQRENEEPARKQTVKSSPKEEAKSVVGIADFTLVNSKSGVANGRKPSIEGLDWLVKSGYKTFVFIHDPKADAKPAKELAEARGLKFVNIPFSEANPKDALAAFDTALATAKDGPVFIADESGFRAGVLWYAHFRSKDLLNPDSAKVRATPLGLNAAETNAGFIAARSAMDEYLLKR